MDIFEDSAIVRFYSYIDGSTKLLRIQYSCDEQGTITLGNVNEVHISYEDIPAVTDEIGVEQATVMGSVEEPVTETSNDEVVKETVSVSTEENFETPVEKTDEQAPVVEENMVHDEPATVVDEASTNTIDATPVANAEVAETNEKVSVDNEQRKEENSSPTSFTESERAEFEDLKREKKLNLLESYKEYISDEDYAVFSATINSFDFKDLEMELLKKYKSHQETSLRKPMRAFALNSLNLNSAKNELDDFVRKNLNR